MSTATAPSPIQREPQLLGQTVVVIGGSSGIGLETARRARAEGAKLVLSGRNPERLEHAARELGALNSAAFDATDLERLDRFFDELPTPIDHVMVTAAALLLAAGRHRLRTGAPQRGRALLGAAPDRSLGRRARCARAERSCSSAERAGAGRPRAHSSRRSPPRYRRSPRRLRSSSHPSASTLSRPASSTRRCRHRCSAISWTRVASNSARRCRSGAWSARPTSPRLPSTS